MLTGAMTALVTPFRGGEVDTRALDALVEAQIAGGIDALVPCGSTGEAATLTHEEHLAVVRAVVRVARGRVPVVAGTGSNSTAEAIRLTRGAEEAGADAALLISPYCNRPTQEGIYRHYAAVAEASLLPLIVYNIPGRTGSNITPETLARLARIPNVVGVKEASGSLAQVLEIIHAAGPDFGVYSGDDILTLPIMAAGGRGVIAMGANLMPRAYAELTHALLAGELAGGASLGVRVADALAAVCRAEQVVLDFTAPAATLAHARIAAERGAGLVIGTTGLDDGQQRELAALAARTRTVFAPNMSVGVTVLTELVSLAARLLDASFEAEVVELHHHAKKDAPSGTALALGRAVAAARGLAFERARRLAREGQVGERPRDEIGIVGLRAGDAVGDHTVVFGGLGERLELVHRAQSRDGLARGALRAALWVAGRPPGLYSMRDVLGL